MLGQKYLVRRKNLASRCRSLQMELWSKQGRHWRQGLAQVPSRGSYMAETNFGINIVHFLQCKHSLLSDLQLVFGRTWLPQFESNKLQSWFVDVAKPAHQNAQAERIWRGLSHTGTLLQNWRQRCQGQYPGNATIDAGAHGSIRFHWDEDRIFFLTRLLQAEIDPAPMAWSDRVAPCTCSCTCLRTSTKFMMLAKGCRWFLACPRLEEKHKEDRLWLKRHQVAYLTGTKEATATYALS